MKKLGVILFSCCFAILMVSTAQAVPFGVTFDADPFDVDGCAPQGGTCYNPEIIYGWDLEGWQVDSMPNVFVPPASFVGDITAVDFITHTTPNGGADGFGGYFLGNGSTFTESILFRVDGSLTSTYAQLTSYTGVLNLAELYLEVSISGSLSKYNVGVDGIAGSNSFPGLGFLGDDSFDANFLTVTGTLFRDANGDRINNDGAVNQAAGFSLESSLPFVTTAGLLTGSGSSGC